MFKNTIDPQLIQNHLLTNEQKSKFKIQIDNIDNIERKVQKIQEMFEALVNKKSVKCENLRALP